MSLTSKRNLSGGIGLVGAVFMMFCIWRMIPYGLSGEVAKVKLYAGLMALAFVIGLIFGVAYYYYRGKLGDDSRALERARVEAEALAQAGKKVSRNGKANKAV